MEGSEVKNNCYEIGYYLKKNEKPKIWAQEGSIGSSDISWNGK